MTADVDPPMVDQPRAIVTLPHDCTDEQLAKVKAAMGDNCTVERGLPPGWVRVATVAGRHIARFPEGDGIPCYCIEGKSHYIDR